MSNDLVTQAQTACLTLAPNTPAARILTNTADEFDLSDEEFAIVARVASEPAPVIPVATEDEINAIVGALAGTLKAARTSLSQGRLQRGVYRKVLGHLTREALKSAADQALRTCDWMPSPSELLKLAEGHKATETLLHGRAVALTRNRRQRLFDLTLAELRERKLPEASLADLDPHTAKVAETQGSIVILPDDRRLYRCKASIELQARMIRERWEGETPALPHDERTIARE